MLRKKEFEKQNSEKLIWRVSSFHFKHVNLLKTRRNTDFFVKKNINCTIGKKCGLKLLAQKKRV